MFEDEYSRIASLCQSLELQYSAANLRRQKGENCQVHCFSGATLEHIPFLFTDSFKYLHKWV